MAASEMDVEGGAESLPEPSRRRAGWERWLAGALMVAFFLSIGSSFVLFPQLRFVFTAVPVILATHDSLTATAPPSADVSPAALDSVEAVVEREVLRDGFPGAALAVGEGDRTLLEAGIGRTAWSRLSAPVDADGTVYDLASLTKVLATTTAVMLLVDDDRLHLDDRVVHWLPEFTGDGREKVTVRDLLTHTSGLQAGMKEVEGSTPDQRFHYLLTHARMIQQPGDMVLYSDVGFVILGRVVERAAGEPMDSLLQRRVWGPLGMSSTRFQPGRSCRQCAPTLTLEDGAPFAGVTNDPLARRLGGKTGNAGLFSTAHDVARYAAMLAGGGLLDGVRVVQESTLHEFTRPQPGDGTRALGFEVFCREGTVPDEKGCRTPYAFGHTGYTGTSLWVDPTRGIWVVLLSNRSYDPQASNDIQVVRRRIFDLATDQPSPVDRAADTTASE
jgi:CubicO group peptidase (beta-lactamase class C family)